MARLIKSPTVKFERLARSDAPAALRQAAALYRGDLDVEPDPDSARRLLSLDPLSETGHRALMRYYADQGQRTLALRQFDNCAAVLQRELGAAPEPATIRLRDTILQRLPPESSQSHSTDLISGSPAGVSYAFL